MKKILKIAGISLAVVAVSALLATGILALIRNKNVAKTGNVLGVSWYNETDKEFSVDTAEQLNELARLSSFYDFKGQTIKLSADIVLNSGDAKDWKSDAPKNRWTPITGFAGTFDGQGHTISGLYGKGHQSAMAMFVNTGDDCTIQNVKLVNSYIETVGSDGSASFVVNGSGTFKQLYSNAIISHRGDRAAGIFSRATRPAVLEECWFDGTIDITISTAGGIVDEVKNTTVDVNHCLFSGTINSSLVPYDAGRTYVGGMVGQVTNTMNQASAARMEDCLSSGVINAQSTNATGSFLGYIASGGQAAATIQNSFASNKTATVPYGSSTGSFTGNAIVTREQELLGEKGYQWTMLDFDNYWVAVENKAPELKWAAKEALDVTGVEKAYDISWYNSNEFMFELKTPEQLYGMAFLSVNGVTFAEKRVKLMKDIVLNEGNAKDWEEKEPELPWYPIANFHGVFDGKGHTVSGIYLKTAAQYQGFFTQVLQTGVVQDLSIKNSYFCSTNETLSMIGTIAGDFRGTLDGVYSDAIVVAHGPQVAGLIARSNDNDESGVTTDKVTVKNCWFDGEVHAKGETTTYAGGLVSAVIQGDLEINHCLNTGTIYSECTGRAIHVAGLVGSVSHVEARLVIKDSMNAGKIEAAYDVGVGSVLGRASSEKHSATFENVYTTEESHLKSIGTSSGTFYGGPIRIPESLYVGNNAYKYTNLDFERNWTLVKGDIPALQQFTTEKVSTEGLAKAVDTSWYNFEDTTFTVKNLKEFYGFAFLATGNNFAGKTVKLGADITVNQPNVAAWKAGTAVPSNVWVSIGNAGMEFDGTFDGQGHVIRGIYVKSDTQYTGLFGRANYNSVIKNFKLTDSYFCNTNTALSMTGSIAGEIRGVMENVYSNAVVEGYGPQIGGMVARINDYDDYVRQTPEEIADKVVVKNCWFDGEVHLFGESNTYAGGVVGALIQGDLEMKDCLNSGTVISDKTTSGTYHIGGLIGSQSHAESRLTLSDSLNVGKIVTQFGEATAAGSILGRVSGEKHSATIKNTFTTTESYVNGIGWTNGIVNGTSYVEKGNNDVAGTKIGRTQLVLRTDKAVKDFFGSTTKAWTCDVINNGLDRGTPILSYFAKWWIGTQPATKEASDTSWYKTTQKEFTLTTLEQLNGLAELSTKYTFEGQTFKLGKDIAVNTVNDSILASWKAGTATPKNVWTPIGSEAKPFAGTFDGQGHIISGLYIDSNAVGVGMFGWTGETAAIKNFKLVDSCVRGNNTATGGIVGSGIFASMSNLYSNAIVRTTNSYAGGMVGRFVPNGSTITVQIENCWFDGEMIQIGGNRHSVGGFIGNDASATNVVFKNCLSTGPVSGGFRVGGFYGWKNNYAVNDFHNCLSVAKVTATPSEAYKDYGAMVGSYFGHYNTSTWNLKLYNSYTSGKNIVGVYKNEGEDANFEIDAYLKDRMTLIETGEKSLFPALSGEQQNAWVNDIGYNKVDRGTPILELFADWWLANNKETGLSEMPKAKVDTGWYNTTATTFTLMDVDDLLGFAELVNSGEDDFAGKTVKLGADIQLNQVDATILAKWVAGTVVPKVEWTPIGTTSTPFAGTFDGQGYSISGLYLNAVAQGSGLFGHVAATSEFKNFKLLDSYLKSSGERLGIVGSGSLARFENVYTNAIMESTTTAVAGFVGYIIPKDNKGNSEIHTTFKNCWFDGNVKTADDKYGAGGFVGLSGLNGNGTGIAFVNCLSTGAIAGGYRLGGFYGWKSNYAKLGFTNCLSVATITATPAAGCEAYGAYVGAYVGDHTTSTYNVSMTNSYGVGTAIFGNYSETTKKFEVDAYLQDRMDIIAAGEKKLFPVLSGEQQNAWVNDIGYNAVDRGTPILETFAEWWLAQNPATDLEEMPGTKADTSWYNETDTEFVLMNADDLLGLAELVNSGEDTFTGKIVKLGADIEINDVDATILAKWIAGTEIADVEWTPIGTASMPFNGTFDGQGHTIRGLYVNSPIASVGLFGQTEAATVIKNFKLVDSYIKATAGNVGLVGTGKIASMQNVYSNAYMESTAPTGDASLAHLGGFVGNLLSIDADTVTSFNNCWFDGEVVGKTTYTAAGFIGLIGSRITIEFNNCLNAGTITSSVNRAGGFIGWLNAGWYVSPSWQTNKWRFNNCLNVGTISGETAYTGSYIGHVGTNVTSLTLTNSYGTGTALIGTVGSGTAPSGQIKDRTYLIETDEAVLFPALTNETENAWVNDIGYNATDRGTPILATFADWWLAVNLDEGLTDRPTNDPSVITPDESWHNDTDTTFTLMDAADLLGFAQLSSKGNTFAGKTIKLGADIALNEVTANILETWKDGSVVPTNVWTPVGTSAAPFAGTFDGQGYTISGLYLNATSANSGLFGEVATPSVIKNFKLVDSYMKTTSGRLGIVGYGTVQSMENIYTNAYMETSTGYAVGGMIADVVPVNQDTLVTFKNCWFDGTIVAGGEMAAGIAGNIRARATLEFSNCLNTGNISCTKRAGGILGYINNGWWVSPAWQTNKWVFNNCLSVGQLTTTGTDTWSVTGVLIAAVNTNVTSMTVNHSYGVGDKLVGKVSSGTVPTGYLKTRQELVDADETAIFPVLTGETVNAWVQDPGFNNTDRGTPILANFAEWWLGRQPTEGVSSRIDTGWYSDAATEFTLTTKAQFVGFAELAKTKNFADKTVKLGADIVLNEVDETILLAWKAGTQVPASTWTPIGSSAMPFAGTFDGQGYTISGLYLSATSANSGLFGDVATPSVIKNFKLVDSYMKTTSGRLGIVGYGTVQSMENIYSNAYMETSTGYSVAGMIADVVPVNQDTLVTFNNCWFDGTIVAGGEMAAGIAGNIRARATLEFNNCLNTGNISCAKRAGGILGYINNGWWVSPAWQTNKWVFNNCLSVGQLTTTGTDTWSVVGTLIAAVNTNVTSMTVNHSYGVGENLVGKISSGTVPTGYLKTREELVNADETAIFPVLTGETVNAWVQDPQFNDTDRGTPILANMAEWWLGRQSTEGVFDRVDTSWYSDEATEFTLTTQAQFVGFAELAKTKNFVGKTVKLGADIVLNSVDADTLAAWKEGTQVPASTWTPIGSSTMPFAGTFDGQGYTISGLYLNATSANSGLFGEVATPSVIKNFKLVDSYMKTTSGRLGIVGYGTVQSMENIYTDAYMETSTGYAVGGMIADVVPVDQDTLVTFSNCWFDGTIVAGGEMAAGIAGNIRARATLEFSNCLNTGNISCTKRAGGILGYINNGWWVSPAWQTNKWVFNNCLSVGQLTTTGTDTWSVVGTLIAAVNTNVTSMTVNHSYGVGENLVGKISSGTVPTGYLKTREELVNADETAIFPVLTGETVNAWVEDAYFNATDRGTPILSTFAGWWLGRQSTEGLTQKADKSWYTGNASEYTLTTAAQLMGLAELAKTNDFAGITIKLGKDITLNEVNETILSAWKAGTGVPARSWTPLGNATTPFAGKFDGQGYTIKGLYVSATTDSVGMFGVVKTGVEIEDFKLVDSYIKGAGKVGLVGNGTVTRIEKVYTNAIIESTGNMAGGFLGYYKGAYTDKNVGASENWANGKITIKNCWFAGEVNMLGSAYSASAFIGGHDQRGAVDMSDCLFTGKVSGERSDYARLGAFFGWLNNTAQYTFTNCLAVGTITSPSTSYVGGFVGNTGTTSGTFTNCYTTISPLVGTGSDQTYVNSGLKTINELQSTGVSTLFTSSAWEDVTGGTPILTYFAN